MRQIQSNYHTLQILRGAKPKLRKAIFSNCDRELVKSICECVLNVRKINANLSDWAKRNLRKNKATPSKVADKHVKLYAKKRAIVQRGGFPLPLLSAVLPTLVGLIFRRHDKWSCCVKLIWFRQVISITARNSNLNLSMKTFNSNPYLLSHRKTPLKINW